MKKEWYEYGPNDYRLKLTATEQPLWVAYFPMGSIERQIQKLTPGDCWKEGTHDLIGIYKSEKDAMAGMDPLPHGDLKSDHLDGHAVSVMKKAYREVKDALDKPFDTWNQHELSRKLLSSYEVSFRPIINFLQSTLITTFMSTLAEWTLDPDKYYQDGDIEFHAKEQLKEQLYRAFPHLFHTWSALLNFQTSSILEHHYDSVFSSHELPGFRGVSLYTDELNGRIIPQLKSDLVECMLNRVDCYHISNALKTPETNCSTQSSTRRKRLNIQKDALEAFFSDESEQFADDIVTYFTNCEFLAEYRACILLNMKIWTECLT